MKWLFKIKQDLFQSHLYLSTRLIVDSDGTMLFPITSFKINTFSFDYSTSELTLSFSESVSKTLVVSWVLLS